MINYYNNSPIFNYYSECIIAFLIFLKFYKTWLWPLKAANALSTDNNFECIVTFYVINVNHSLSQLLSPTQSCDNHPSLSSHIRNWFNYPRNPNITFYIFHPPASCPTHCFIYNWHISFLIRGLPSLILIMRNLNNTS